MTLFSVNFSGLALAAIPEPSGEAEDAAQAAADAWLALVDSGDAPGSWDAAAALFKSVISKEQWEQTLNGFRPPFGKVLSRKASSRSYKEELPGAPDGKYVVIQYESSFEHKASAIETVTPMMDPDGVWRVSGYFMK